MNTGTLLYPRLSCTWLPAMIGSAVIGSLFAGAYGILHDQIAYSIFGSVDLPRNAIRSANDREPTNGVNVAPAKRE